MVYKSYEQGDAFIMVHVYKIGISESVFTDHRMLNSETGICFSGKQSCYTLVIHTHIFVCHSSAEVVIQCMGTPH
jgi:hypothetical protein